MELSAAERKKQRMSQIQKFNYISPTRPVMKYMPTYRLESKNPLNRVKCDKMLRNVMEHTFAGFQYTPKGALIACAQVSEEIKIYLKSQNFDRYRYIIIVTVGEKIYQGFSTAASFLWDIEKDGYLSYAYDNPKFFAVTTIYYIYFD